jgi:formylmethanofuran--tetrahydromethanopterin N-formyltransferase
MPAKTRTLVGDGTVKNHLELNGVEVEDTHIEVNELLSGRVLVTSITKEIALRNTRQMSGALVTSAPIEGIVGGTVPASETPDARPGSYLLLRGHSEMKPSDRKGREAFGRVFTNHLRMAPHLPTCAIYDGVPKSDALFRVNAGETIRLWGDGFETEGKVADREVYRIPVMLGEFVTEKTFGISTSFDGAFEVFAENPSCALMATQIAADRVVDEVKGAFASNLCGAKVGGVNYKEQNATTTTFFCPTIRDKVSDTRVPEGVGTVIEYLVWGLDLQTVKEGLRISLETITKVPGITGITVFNQGGLWGQHKIQLRELLSK